MGRERKERTGPQKNVSNREQPMRKKERSGTMDKRKFTATLAALAVGIALSVGSAVAQNPPFVGTAGYLQGDPAPGKLIPYFIADGATATIIGIENTIGNAGPQGAEIDIPVPPTTVHISGGDIRIHVHVFDTHSNEILNFIKCYSPFDFGYIVLQKGAVTAAQNDDLDFPTGPNATRRNKSQVVVTSVAEGYVSIRAERVFGTGNGTCSEEVQFGVSVDIPDSQDLVQFALDNNLSVSDFGPLSWPLATWAIAQNISTGFFATEIPTATARVDNPGGEVHGGIGAFGLIPQGNEVIARYDANTFNLSVSYIFAWFTENGNSTDGFLECEDELEISTPIPLPFEVNVLKLSGSSTVSTTPDLAGPLGVCTDPAIAQYRGVLRFTMPETGFLWSHITQENAHFRMNFLGYNLQNNWFVDCADGFLDFDRPDGITDCQED
jgi:hypothetical protein